MSIAGLPPPPLHAEQNSPEWIPWITKLRAFAENASRDARFVHGYHQGSLYAVYIGNTWMDVITLGVTDCISGSKVMFTAAARARNDQPACTADQYKIHFRIVDKAGAVVAGGLGCYNLIEAYTLPSGGDYEFTLQLMCQCDGWLFQNCVFAAMVR